MVRVVSDVRQLLKRHLEMRKTNSFVALLVRLDSVLLSAAAGNPDDHVMRVFTRLMLRGRVCETLRFATEMEF